MPSALLWLIALCTVLVACASSAPSPASPPPGPPAASAAPSSPRQAASPAAPAVAASGAARPAGGATALDTAREQTADRARLLRASVVLWMASNPAECPSLETIVNARLAAPTPPITDAWGQRFRVMCSEDSATIESVGPDGKQGTADDLLELR